MPWQKFALPGVPQFEGLRTTGQVQMLNIHYIALYIEVMLYELCKFLHIVFPSLCTCCCLYMGTLYSSSSKFSFHYLPLTCCKESQLLVKIQQCSTDLVRLKQKFYKVLMYDNSVFCVRALLEKLIMELIKQYHQANCISQSGI